MELIPQVDQELSGLPGWNFVMLILPHRILKKKMQRLENLDRQKKCSRLMYQPGRRRHSLDKEQVDEKEEQKPGNPIGDILGGICKGIGDFFKGIGEMIFGKVTDDNKNDGTKHVMMPGGQEAEVEPPSTGKTSRPAMEEAR